MSRPRIAAVNNEVAGIALQNSAQMGDNPNYPFDLKNLPIFPIETSQVSLNLQNALTDYDFKVENL